MANETVKWAVGAVLVPIGLSLAVSGVSIASFKGAQEVKNDTFENEILESKQQLKEDMQKIAVSMQAIAASQKVVETQQIELAIKAEMRDKEIARLYSELKGVRDSFRTMQHVNE